MCGHIVKLHCKVGVNVEVTHVKRPFTTFNTKYQIKTDDMIGALTVALIKLL